MIKVFISYAHEDEKYKNELAKHVSALVRQGVLEEWNDRQVKAGDEWDQAIKSKLNQANIILFLVSKNFIASDYINDVEIHNAITRHKKGEVRIVPILINYCFFDGSPIAQFPIFPKGNKPIQAWKNPDEAWLDVIHGILNTIADFKGKNANNFVAKYNLDARQDAKEVKDIYNLQTPQGQVEIGKKIENLRLQGPMGNYQLVNINREKPKDSWWDAYDEKVSKSDFFQFYFMTACPTQMPPSFAERMIYELINEELEDSPEAIHFETVPDSGRVAIRDLPMKRNLAKTKEEFKKYFCQRFDFQDTEFDFQKFIKEGIPRLNYQYVASVFKISSLKWKDFLGEFFEWIVETFQDEHEELPTFLFFFVVSVEHAHLPGKLVEKDRNIIMDLEKISSSNSNSTMFKQLNPVNIDDVKLWFSELGEENPDKITDLVNSVVLGLDSDKQHIYEKKDLLDMSTIEVLQELVFKIINK